MSVPSLDPMSISQKHYTCDLNLCRLIRLEEWKSTVTVFSLETFAVLGTEITVFLHLSKERSFDEVYKQTLS